MGRQPRAASTLELTALTRVAIEEELASILASPQFRNSKRYPALFQYIVESTLNGNTERLKEKQLGVDVFHREQDYDTTIDPVVRMSVSEIRKRLAQYYMESEGQSSIQIRLNAGSYIPVFQSFTHEAQPVETFPGGSDSDIPVDEIPARETSPQQILTAFKPKLLVALAILFVAGLLASVGWFYREVYNKQPQRAFELFWRPWLDPNDGVVLCLGSPSYNLHHPVDENEQIAGWGAKAVTVVPADVTIAFNIAQQVQTLNANERLRLLVSNDANFDDFRTNQSILIGANNKWSLRILTPLRFHMEFDGLKSGTIVDRQNLKRNWTVSFEQPFSALTYDYGIIARVQDPATGRRTLVLAGILQGGTAAAAELVTKPKYLQGLTARLPRGWETRNLEVVVGTQMIGTRSGVPEILDVYSW